MTGQATSGGKKTKSHFRFEEALGGEKAWFRHRRMFRRERSPDLSQEQIEDAVLTSLAITSLSRSELVLPFSDHRRAIWVFRKG